MGEKSHFYSMVELCRGLDIVKHPKYVAGKHYVLCIYNVKGQDAVEAAIVLDPKAAAKTPPTIKK